MATIAFKKYTDLNKVTTVTDSYLFAVHTGEELVAITTANLKTALGIAGAGGDISTLKSYFQNGVLKTANGGTGSSTVDAAPSENSDNMVKSGGVYTALAGKQDVLQFDSTPATGSSNPVTSAGIFAAQTAPARSPAPLFPGGPPVHDHPEAPRLCGQCDAGNGIPQAGHSRRPP